MIVAVKDIAEVKVPYTTLKEELKSLRGKKIVWDKLGLEFPLSEVDEDQMTSFIKDYDKSLEEKGYTYLCVPNWYSPKEL